MKLAIVLFTLCAVSRFGFAEQESLAIENPSILHCPQKFSIIEKMFSWCTRFDVETESEKVGRVRKRLISLGSSFIFEGIDGVLLATTKSQYFSWGTIADVYDGTDKSIGWIEEQIPTWFSPSRYHIFGADKRLAAIARMNFWGTKFTIKDPHDNYREVAIISRPWLRFFRNKWNVQILDPEATSNHRIDLRMLVMTAIYRSDTEHLNKRQTYFETLQDNNSLFYDQSMRLAVNELLEELDYYLNEYHFTGADEKDEYDSEEEIERDEKLADINMDDDDEISLADAPVSHEDFKVIREKARLIQVIKILKKGSEILRDPHIEQERKAATRRLLKQYLKEISL
jgi:hypothetical protein